MDCWVRQIKPRTSQPLLARPSVRSALRSGRCQIDVVNLCELLHHLTRIASLYAVLPSQRGVVDDGVTRPVFQRRFQPLHIPRHQKDWAILFLWYFRLDSPSTSIVIAAFSANFLFTLLIISLCIRRFSFLFSVVVFFCSRLSDFSWSRASLKDEPASLLYTRSSSLTTLLVNA